VQRRKERQEKKKFHRKGRIEHKEDFVSGKSLNFVLFALFVVNLFFVPFAFFAAKILVSLG
jgi:hypothetical protein